MIICISEFKHNNATHLAIILLYDKANKILTPCHLWQYYPISFTSLHYTYEHELVHCLQYSLILYIHVHYFVLLLLFNPIVKYGVC